MYIWLAALSVFLIILLPVAAAIAARRRWGSPWIYFAAGAATFIVAQLIHLPLNRLLRAIGILPESIPEGSSLIVTALILSLTAALSEELARTGGYAILKKARKFGDGIMLGVGHGGIEAMIVAIILAASAGSFFYIQRTDLLPEGISAEQWTFIGQVIESAEGQPLLTLAPLVERTISLAYQLVFSILILTAFRTRRWWFVAAAVSYHALVDFAAIISRESIENIWISELLLAAILLPGLVWYWRQRQSSLGEGLQLQPERSIKLENVRPSFAKEWSYQVRTKRLIVAVAVFLLFGMISPLTAKYMPQLLSNIEGAEQFAALVPEPTVADALAQLISNLTQFGFILAILLGMSAVAGEKEKGTAAMVLSKPLSRWMFIGSKFVSQAVVFFISILLAAFAAYFYTYILFQALEIVPYLSASLLMYLWLMVFAAVTVLGSTLGRTSAAAAGISAGIGVLLLIIGSIPKYGALAPGGLIAWAGQLALDSATEPNFGAVAAAVVVIILALLTAIGALEQQEI